MSLQFGTLQYSPLHYSLSILSLLFSLPLFSLPLALYLSVSFSLSFTLFNSHTFNSSEEKLYNCVMTYAAQFNNDQPKKDEVLNLLLPCLRFNFINVEFLVNT